MRRPTIFKCKRVLIAVEKHGKSISEACEAAGTTRQTYYKYLREMRDHQDAGGVDPKPGIGLDIFPPPLTEEDRKAILFNIGNPVKGMEPLPLIVRRYEATVRNMAESAARGDHYCREVFRLSSERNDLLALVADLALKNHQARNGRTDVGGATQAHP